jgi:hypothetical protein
MPNLLAGPAFRADNAGGNLARLTLSKMEVLRHLAVSRHLDVLRHLDNARGGPAEHSK